MNFITIDPKRNKLSNLHARGIVRAVFSKSKRSKVEYYKLTLYLGKDIANELKLRAGDKISIAYGETDKRKWLIKKANVGYTLSEVVGETSPAYRILLPWQVYQADEKEMTLRELKHIKHDGGILVDANL
jgi:hypothetical protein